MAAVGQAPASKLEAEVRALVGPPVFERRQPATRREFVVRSRPARERRWVSAIAHSTSRAVIARTATVAAAAAAR